MGTITVKDARNHLKRLLDRVHAGEEVSILRRGKVVARLVPPTRHKRRLPSLKSLRSSIRMSGRPLSKTVLQNRKEERF